MARGRKKKAKSGPGAKPDAQGAVTGYEAELWRMADTLRGSMDAAEYKHVVLGLIFLKYISDAFEERREAVLADSLARLQPSGAVPSRKCCRVKPGSLMHGPSGVRAIED